LLGVSVWFRVFGTNDVLPEPAAILAHLRNRGMAVVGKFYNDEEGWFQAELLFGDEEPTLHLECFLATEEGVRADLRAWAAWLETVEQNPNHQRLMEHMIATKRVLTLHESDEGPKRVALKELCVELSKFLARQTAGVYQVDDQGFFDADGTLLLEEREP
jgi:hypothetical protein